MQLAHLSYIPPEQHQQRSASSADSASSASHLVQNNNIEEPKRANKLNGRPSSVDIRLIRCSNVSFIFLLNLGHFIVVFVQSLMLLLPA
jgi:hypothetical protein